jgi:hypothetical protein
MGFVHGDLKPHNMCMGRDDFFKENMVHLIDFGSSFQYRDQNGQHKPYKFENKHPGNIMFGSVSICKGMT